MYSPSATIVWHCIIHARDCTEYVGIHHFIVSLTVVYCLSGRNVVGTLEIDGGGGGGDDDDNDVAARQTPASGTQHQTSATVHGPPLITSTPVPVTSAQVPTTSQRRNGAAGAAAAAMTQSATTVESMTYSHTTL